jgi:hypothetical protein
MEHLLGSYLRVSSFQDPTVKIHYFNTSLNKLRLYKSFYIAGTGTEQEITLNCQIISR